jgi:hypothetical protein
MGGCLSFIALDAKLFFLAFESPMGEGLSLNAAGDLVESFVGKRGL